MSDPAVTVTADRLSLAYASDDVAAVRARCHADVLAALEAHGRAPAGPPEVAGRDGGCVVECPLVPVAPAHFAIAAAFAGIAAGSAVAAEPVTVYTGTSIDGGASRFRVGDAVLVEVAAPAPDGPGDDAA